MTSQLWTDSFVSQCDGAQPVCSRCSSRTVGCTWSADPDTTPMLAMKQKYEILESECRDLHGLMQSLIDCPRQQAFNILDNLRKTRNVSLTLSLVGDDDTLVDLTNTANLQSISSNLPTSAHEYLRHVQDAVVSRTRGHPSSSEDFRKPHSAESHFLMRRLAISDLIITGNT
jgi:hypothetical protein